jgi:hypothetical protein
MPQNQRGEMDAMTNESCDATSSEPMDGAAALHAYVFLPAAEWRSTATSYASGALFLLIVASMEPHLWRPASRMKRWCI